MQIAAMTTGEAAELIYSSARELCLSRGRAIIAVDGRCAGGKTTLALAAQTLIRNNGIPCRALHTDDFFLRPEQRTEQRMSEPGGNVDYERLISEVLLPLSRGESFIYRPYRCHGEQPAPYPVDPCGVTLIEGAYSLRPDMRGYYDYMIFAEVSSELQSERITGRNGAVGARAFAEKWIPLEERYIEATHPELAADSVIRLVGK